MTFTSRLFRLRVSRYVPSSYSGERDLFNLLALIGIWDVIDGRLQSVNMVTVCIFDFIRLVHPMY